MSKGYFWDEALTFFKKKAIFCFIGFSCIQTWIVSKWIFPKKIEAMSKGYFFDQAVTNVFLKTFFSSLDFPVFNIGLFQHGFFFQKEAMSKRYFWDEALTIFFKDVFFLY